MADTDDPRARWEKLWKANPGVEDRIAEMVAGWGPIPDDALALWRGFRRDYLAKHPAQSNVVTHP